MTRRRLIKAAAMLSATAVAVILAMVVVEAWVRLSWDERRGTPGFYVSDPVLGQRLAANYRGWFAGVPVEINSLGFRDSREYALEKSPRTFRILVLGDSVTFGHGAISTTTYPYLLEQRLRQWRPDVEWQVWNLGVPGYNTRTELEYLREVGPRYRPDLVVVGFFANDLAGNAPAPPSVARRAASAVQRVMQRRLYSYELYKRIALTLRWRLFTSGADRGPIEALAAEDALLAAPEDLGAHPSQQLTAVDRFDDLDRYRCPRVEPSRDPNRDRLAARLGRDVPEMAAWKAAVAEFQRLHTTGQYSVAFFINMAPNLCPEEDRYYDDGALEDDAALRRILGQGTPAGSSVREFLAYRPSQMPFASGHSIGNANRVKADALFAFLSSDVLPGLLK